MKVLLLLFCLLFFPKENSQLKIPGKLLTEKENVKTRVEEWSSLEKSDEEEENETYPTMEEMRLPKTLVPEKYWLTLQLFFPAENYTYPEDRDFTFDGHVKILIKCLNDTDLIVLNGVDLEINEGSFQLQSEDGKTIQLKGKISIHKKRQLIEFPLEQSLRQGRKYTLELKYKGKINEEPSSFKSSLNGIYRSYYMMNGQKVWLAVTQFEPEDARRAFPGFDEPDMKATFCLRIRHPASLTAISNTMERRSVHIRRNLVETKFSETPRMSSYLLAFAVSDFQKIEKISQNGKLIRVWAPPTQLKFAEFAAEIAPRLMDFFENYFKIPYPLEKLDLISLPHFLTGGMENWGLVTFHEKSFLCNPWLNSNQTKKYTSITGLIAHELSHQWFGNLVTMKWWDNLWLNEGFATLFGYKGTKFVLGESYDEPTHFLHVIQLAMEKDQGISHPLLNEDISYRNPMDMFDRITYKKGASVLAMVRNVIGEDRFLKGLSAYLKKFQYQNTDHNDLWTALSAEAAGNKVNQLNFKEFALDWTIQPGYPLVSVVRDYTDGTARITQTRFAVGFTPPKEQRWHVPIWYTTDANPQVNLTWLQPDEDGVLEGLKDVDWLLINPGVRGFYRVNYDTENWRRIIQQLKCNHLAVPMTSRAQLVADAFILVQQKLLSREVFLKLGQVLLVKETEYKPLTAVIFKLMHIAEPYKDTAEYYYPWKLFISALSPIYWEHGWNKPIIAYALCGLGDNLCLTDVRKTFSELKITCKDQLLSGSCNQVDESNRGYIYSLGVEFGTGDDWEFLWEKFQSETQSKEKRRLIYGLASTKEMWRIDWLLNASLELKGSNLFEVVVKLLLGGGTGRLIAFDFLKQNWPTIKATLETDKNDEIVELINVLIYSSKHRMELIEQVQEFLWNKDLGLLESFDEKLEGARKIAKQDSEDKLSIIGWFQDYVKNNKIR